MMQTSGDEAETGSTITNEYGDGNHGDDKERDCFRADQRPRTSLTMTPRRSGRHVYDSLVSVLGGVLEGECPLYKWLT